MTTTRRTALKILGGCLVVPSLKIRPEYDLHRIVSDFCDDGSFVRFDLGSPWVAGGQAYGTDGRAAARIATDESDIAEDERRVPKNINEIWETYWTETGVWRPLPPERLLETTGPCPECCEKPFVTCEPCDGWGCDNCHGVGGHKKCSACGGEAWGWHPNLQPFGHKRICVTYLRKLQRIPGAMWNIGDAARNSPILLKSDIGIESLVMPVVLGE